MYIEDGFFSTLAYKYKKNHSNLHFIYQFHSWFMLLSTWLNLGFIKLILVCFRKLTKELERSIGAPDAPDKVLKIMKSIEFFFKFIIKSFQNHRRVLLME